MKRFVIISLSAFVVLLAGYGTVTLLTQGVSGEIDQHEKSTEKAAKGFEKSLNKSNRMTRANVIRLVNADRENHNLPPLLEEPRLNETAQAKAEDMVKNGYYGHKDSQGVEGYSTVFGSMPECRYASENLTAAETASEAVKTWKASKPHHQTILNPKYDYTGLGIANDGDFFYVVQHFCDL